MKTVFPVVIMFLILSLVAGCGQQQSPLKESEPLSKVGNQVQQNSSDRGSKFSIVEITKDGFNPSTLTINKGGSVQFVNRDINPHWPASAEHPTHTAYPGSGVEKCGTAEQKNIFDACKGLAQGETFTFIFDQTGTWAYHDHLNIGSYGKIIVNNPPENKNIDTVSTGSVLYFPGKSEYAGYLARPAQSGKYPALILIHEWWGLNDNIRQLAQDFAKEGYVVLAVDLYGESATTDRQIATRLAGEVTANEALAFENLDYAVKYLKSNPNVDPERIGSVGWCFGGGWSYQMAKNNLGIRASVMYYGRFNPKDDLSMMRAQILGHFGEKDMSISVDSVTEFQAKLKSLSGDHAVYIYPNAGHGFANEDGASYDKVAADIAWERTMDFLEKNVKSK